jgi:hypothetical protein
VARLIMQGQVSHALHIGALISQASRVSSKFVLQVKKERISGHQINAHGTPSLSVLCQDGWPPSREYVFISKGIYWYNIYPKRNFEPQNLDSIVLIVKNDAFWAPLILHSLDC